jgi:hypothetical protein
MTTKPRSLDAAGCRALAGAIGESPFTITSVHNLLAGRCKAWAIGEPARPEAAVVQMNDLPSEPEGYGQPDLVWKILRRVPDWDCVSVSWEAGPAVAEIMQREAGINAALYDDLYHVLKGPAVVHQHPDVRLLTLADVPLMRRMGELDLGHDGYDTPEAAVMEGAFAAAIVEGQIVAVTKATAVGRQFANIGAETHADYRCRGYCTVAASPVARRLQELGLTPVWSAGHTNAASLRVAAKIGFEPYDRKVYVNRRPKAKAE